MKRLYKKGGVDHRRYEEVESPEPDSITSRLVVTQATTMNNVATSRTSNKLIKLIKIDTLNDFNKKKQLKGL